MKIADRTPFRNDNGQIDIWGRVQGTLKFGIGWSARLEAQDRVIGVLDKILGSNFILLRNITLPDTEIDLPLVLIGPPGIYLINITPERGVYRARDDEWGTVLGEKFVPAAINQVQRTVKLGRVLQIYLERAGYKGSVVVDPILMAADPGMHIESIRPAARIVMSDALERFAISMNQAHIIFTSKMIIDLAQVIVNGQNARSATEPPTAVETAPGMFQEPISEEASHVNITDESAAFSSDSLGFSFEETTQHTPALTRTPDEQKPTTERQSEPDQHTAAFVGFDERLGSLQEAGSQFFEIEEPELAEKTAEEPTDKSIPGQDMLAENRADNTDNQPEERAQPAKTSKKRLFGMTNRQLLTLLGILIFWVCIMIGFAAYVYFNLNV